MKKTNEEVKLLIAAFLSIPRKILDCTNKTISTDVYIEDKQFHQCWRDMVDSGAIQFTKIQDLQPILCFVKEDDAKT